MKRAKQRPHPSLAQLISSTPRADRAIDRSPAVCTKEKRILRIPKRSLVEIILQMPEGLPLDLDFENAPPIGREIL